MCRRVIGAKMKSLGVVLTNRLIKTSARPLIRNERTTVMFLRRYRDLPEQRYTRVRLLRPVTPYIASALVCKFAASHATAEALFIYFNLVPHQAGSK